jgi:hypothetical protein
LSWIEYFARAANAGPRYAVAVIPDFVAAAVMGSIYGHAVAIVPTLACRAAARDRYATVTSVVIALVTAALVVRVAELAAVREPVVFISREAAVGDLHAAVVEGVPAGSDRAARIRISHATIEEGIVVIIGFANHFRRGSGILNARVGVRVVVSAVRA